MGEDEFRLVQAEFGHHFVDGFVGGLEGVVAGIEEADFGAEDFGGAGGFGASNLLDAFDGHAGLLPGSLALAALAVGEAEDADFVAAGGVEGDGAAGAPDEIGCVGADYKDRFIFHDGIPRMFILRRVAQR